MKFFATPKGLLFAILIGVGFLAALVIDADGDRLLPNLLVATGTAVGLDLGITALNRGKWAFPDGALLTGLIIGLVLRPQEPMTVALVAAIVAILTKQFIRTRWSNVLNPAAVGLVFAGAFMGAGQDWWGALPSLGVFGAVAVGGVGLYIADRVNKLPMVMVFLGGYLALFTVASLAGHADLTAEIFRTPDIQAALFFAMFMLDDPPTCPVRYEDQVVYGLIVATVAYFIFMTSGPVYFLPAALLVGNVWESGRRIYMDWQRRQLAA